VRTQADADDEHDGLMATLLLYPVSGQSYGTHCDVSGHQIIGWWSILCSVNDTKFVSRLNVSHRQWRLKFISAS